MSTPLIAIVGRTNVGKSALFNRLIGRRLAVVEDRPGVTRDRLYATTDILGRKVTLIDTGGLIGGEEDVLVNMVAEHARIALEEADLLLLIVDGQEGLTSHDLEVADIARKSGKPYIVVANKMEKTRLDSADFAALRLGLPVDVSALHNVGIEDLKDAILDALPPESEEPEPEDDRIAIAVVGRPNVGKSSIVNALLGQERVIVSPIPGTTREAVDVPLSTDGRDYLLVDTAGLRRQSRSKEAIEFYATLRTAKAVERAHAVLLIVDAAEGVTIQDQRIAGMAEEAGRATAILANKWDVVQARGAVPGANPVPETERQTKRFDRLLRKDFEKHVRERLAFLDYATLLFTSATDGQGLADILPLCTTIAESFSRRISTGALNRALVKATAKHAPPSRKGRRLKVYYITQVAAEPPAMACFVNDPALMHWSYQRYLVNFLRQEFGFQGTPIRLFVRASHERGREAQLPAER
jgi:GTPase